MLEVLEALNVRSIVSPTIVEVTLVGALGAVIAPWNAVA